MERLQNELFRKLQESKLEAEPGIRRMRPPPILPQWLAVIMCVMAPLIRGSWRKVETNGKFLHFPDLTERHYAGI